MDQSGNKPPPKPPVPPIEDNRFRRPPPVRNPVPPPPIVPLKVEPPSVVQEGKDPRKPIAVLVLVALLLVAGIWGAFVYLIGGDAVTETKDGLAQAAETATSSEPVDSTGIEAEADSPQTSLSEPMSLPLSSGAPDANLLVNRLPPDWHEDPATDLAHSVATAEPSIVKTPAKPSHVEVVAGSPEGVREAGQVADRSTLQTRQIGPSGVLETPEDSPYAGDAPTKEDGYPYALRMRLAAPLQAMVLGGGGKYLFLKVEESREIKVFNLDEMRVAGNLRAPSANSSIAANQEYVYASWPERGRVLSVDLSNLAGAASYRLPAGLPVEGLMIGPNSRTTPLYVDTGDRFIFLDPVTLSEQHEMPYLAGFSKIRYSVSADGSAFAHWNPSLSPSGINHVTQFEGELVVRRDHVSGGMLTLSHDGTMIYATDAGIYRVDEDTLTMTAQGKGLHFAASDCSAHFALTIEKKGFGLSIRHRWTGERLFGASLLAGLSPVRDPYALTQGRQLQLDKHFMLLLERRLFIAVDWARRAVYFYELPEIPIPLDPVVEAEGKKQRPT